MGTSQCFPCVEEICVKYEIPQDKRKLKGYVEGETSQIYYVCNPEFSGSNTYEERIMPKGNIYDHYKSKSSQQLCYNKNKKPHKRMTNNINPCIQSRRDDYHRSKTQKFNRKQDTLSVHNYSDFNPSEDKFYPKQSSIEQSTNPEDSISNKLGKKVEVSRIDINISSTLERI